MVLNRDITSLTLAIIWKSLSLCIYMCVCLCVWSLDVKDFVAQVLPQAAVVPHLKEVILSRDGLILEAEEYLA